MSRCSYRRAPTCTLALALAFATRSNPTPRIEDNNTSRAGQDGTMIGTSSRRRELTSGGSAARELAVLRSLMRSRRRPACPSDLPRQYRGQGYSRCGGGGVTTWWDESGAESGKWQRRMAQCRRLASCSPLADRRLPSGACSLGHATPEWPVATPLCGASWRGAADVRSRAQSAASAD